MDRGSKLAAVLKRDFGVRVGPHTVQFAARHLERTAPDEKDILLLGGDSRTGVPIRKTIPRADLLRALTS